MHIQLLCNRTQECLEGLEVPCIYNFSVTGQECLEGLEVPCIYKFSGRRQMVNKPHLVHSFINLALISFVC